MAADSFVFVIEEASGTDPIRVELQDHDLPFGRPRRGGAFDLGGPVNIEKVLLDGRSAPIIHTKQADYHPTVVKGHLRDHFTGVDGHAHSVKDQLERIRLRMRPVKLSIWRYSWKGLLDDAKFPFEGANDLPYELHFTVLQGIGASVTPPPVDGPVHAPADQMAFARAVLAERQGAFLALVLSRVARAQVAAAFSAAATSMDAAQSAAYDFEAGAQSAKKQASSLIARCQDAKSKCDDLIAFAKSLLPGDALPKATAGTLATFTMLRVGTIADASDIKATMRSLQLTARQSIRSASKLYQVASDDTPESIAQSQLGSAARASELGLKLSDLVLGKFIRIPRA